MRELEIQLKRLHGQNYGRYRSLQNTWKSGNIRCRLTHIQGDPYAPLSTLSIKVPLVETKIPSDYYENPLKLKALCDFIHRSLVEIIAPLASEVGDGNSGLIHIDTVGPEILSRSAVQVKKSPVNTDEIEIRLGVGLPGENRKILGDTAIELLTFQIPEIWTRVCYWQNIDQSALRDHLKAIQNQEAYRSQLEDKNLVAWIQEGSVLARDEGFSSAKLTQNAVPFETPQSLMVELEDASGTLVKGMGVPKGLTLIAGGGYHGKSTFLHAIEQGIYNHIPGDGREGVVCRGDALKVKSEEGRSIRGLNLSPFIGELPNGLKSEKFTSNNASGSTSQFANLIEGYESGAKSFLIDEDLSAVNALVRDERMQALLRDYSEPIIPLIDRIAELKELQLDFIMVIGASGVYLDEADTVIVMKDYKAYDASSRSQEVIAELPSRRKSEQGAVELNSHRVPDLKDLHSKLQGMQRWPKVKLLNRSVMLGELESICQSLDQVNETNQYKMMAHSVAWMIQKQTDRQQTVTELVKHWQNTFKQGGFDSIQSVSSRDLTEVRGIEVACFLNRLSALSLMEV